MLCSLAVALGVYFAANETGSWLIGRFYLSDSAVRARNLSAIEELQSYVQEKNLSSHNTDEIARWTISKRDIYILLYKDQRLALESGWYGIENNKNADEQVLSDQPTVSAYPVCFRDGVFQAVIYDYSDSHLYTLAEIVSIILACVLFASMMLIYNRHITRQIVTISKEVQEIGQGNLHLSMTAKGNDELARLSDSVEAMRLSLLSKTDQERKALEKNSELITAMSHDLRNPLTALLGYLDLAKNRQYRSQEELEQYIGAAYDKAARLKTLSDELFRYALLFGNQELHMNFEEYDAVILFEQLLGEQSAAAQSRGFTVKAATPQQTSVRVRADVLYLKRVFDNLFDNVRKYADPGKPLNIAVFAENGQIHVCICNTVAPQPDKTESSLVGLKTCRRIMEGMGGGFATYEEGKNFTAEVWLPILPENLPQS
jgi:signal transduction histidine kinase